ncbi:hypothetical protein HDU67_003848, partial [Dinochytrium kinnereticum]
MDPDYLQLSRKSSNVFYIRVLLKHAPIRGTPPSFRPLWLQVTLSGSRTPIVSSRNTIPEASFCFITGTDVDGTPSLHPRRFQLGDATFTGVNSNRHNHGSMVLAHFRGSLAYTYSEAQFREFVPVSSTFSLPTLEPPFSLSLSKTPLTVSRTARSPSVPLPLSTPGILGSFEDLFSSSERLQADSSPVPATSASSVGDTLGLVNSNNSPSSPSLVRFPRTGDAEEEESERTPLIGQRPSGTLRFPRSDPVRSTPTSPVFGTAPILNSAEASVSVDTVETLGTLAASRVPVVTPIPRVLTPAVTFPSRSLASESCTPSSAILSSPVLVPSLPRATSAPTITNMSASVSTSSRVSDGMTAKLAQSRMQDIVLNKFDPLDVLRFFKKIETALIVFVRDPSDSSTAFRPYATLDEAFMKTWKPANLH